MRNVYAYLYKNRFFTLRSRHTMCRYIIYYKTTNISNVHQLLNKQNTTSENEKNKFSYF